MTVRLVSEAVLLVALGSLVPLGICGVVSLVISVVQAATQVQEQTIPFLVKLLVAAAVAACGLPWAAKRSVAYVAGCFDALAVIGRAE